MTSLFAMFMVQGFLGAFDTIYHHELTERLPWRITATRELKLHGVRNFIYSIIFLSLAWLAWNGVFAWVFVGMLAVEVLITLADFVEEDKTRKLPHTERITHTVLTLNYGIILALLMPVLLQWSSRPSGFSPMNFGVWSWMMTLYACGTLLWGLRDLVRGIFWSRNMKESMILFPALRKSYQHILITGGTGFIGKALCQTLINQGHAVTILTRNIAKAAALFHGRVTLIESLEMLHENDRFDVIINLAGEPISRRWSTEAKSLIKDSRLNTTEALIEYMKRASTKPAVFISGSAIGIYGTNDEKIYDEGTIPSLDETGMFPRQICELWEASAQKAEQLGIRTCLLRTGIVLETDGGALAQMLFPFEFGLGGPMGDGKQWMSWIHRDDLIRLVFHIINNESLRGPVNATAPIPVTNRTFSHALGKAIKRPAIIPLPAFQVSLLFGEMGKALLLSGQKVIPQKALNSNFTFNYPDIDVALKQILT